MLCRNVAAMPNVQPRNVAVFPSAAPELTLFARYGGDGEAVIAGCMERIFAAAPPQVYSGPCCHPADLPRAHIVKLDVEGAEASILSAMDLSTVELLMLEFHDDAKRAAIRRMMARDFIIEHEDVYLYDDLVHARIGYRDELIGNHFGRMFFSARECRLLRR